MVFDALVFGILQGLLEWLPISSQGSIGLLMVGLSGFDPSFAIRIAVILHIGTLLSVLVYFRKDVWEILKSLPGYRGGFGENRLITFLIISTLLTGIIGYPLYKYMAVSSMSGELFIGLVGAALIVTGLVQKFSLRNEGNKTGKDLSLKDSIILGIMQGVSAIPGISRSGMTISGLLFRKYYSRDALRISFLMSIPAILGAEIGLGLIEGTSILSIATSDILVGVAAAFIVGLLSIHVLLKVAKRVRFWAFCIVMGIVALIPTLLWLF